jgi:protein-S-isoprenylcysteine O-methyltransferase Ste14
MSSKTSSKMSNHPAPCPIMLRFRPPRIALALLLGAAIVHAILPASAAGLPPLPAGGAILGLLGGGIMLRAWWLFKKHVTPICPTATTTTLVTDDVYRLTRNPMYLGIVLMLLGTALATGGLAFYVAALAFFLIIDSVFCPFEETALSRGCGERYANYAAQVRRWL